MCVHGAQINGTLHTAVATARDSGESKRDKKGNVFDLIHSAHCTL